MDDLIDRVTRLARPALGGFGVLWLAIGLWAFVSPRSFFDTLAEFEPYNRHFLHDAGAMQIGIGVGAIAAAWTLRPVLSALLGVTAFHAVHLLSHVIDRDLGGRPWFDIPSLALAAVASTIALAVSRRSDRASTAEPGPPQHTDPPSDTSRSG